MKRYKYFWFIFLLVGIGFIPLPYDIVQPGSVRALDQIIKVESKESNGQFHMVTIRIDHANGFSIMKSLSHPYARIIPSISPNWEQERKNMIVSRETAQKVAFAQSNYPPRNVTFALEDVGGPSAGFMMTLELLDQNQTKDLTRGYQIAGTGTIESDGRVGKVGGVQFKLIAADQKGMDIFFVPAANMPELVSFLDTYSTDMDIVPVETIHDALEYLEKRKEHA